MREFLGFMLFFCLKVMLCIGIFAFLAASFRSHSFNRDGSMSQDVVVIPALIFTGMIVFFYMCVDYLRDINENLTTLNKNIVAI